MAVAVGWTRADMLVGYTRTALANAQLEKRG